MTSEKNLIAPIVARKYYDLVLALGPEVAGVGDVLTLEWADLARAYAARVRVVARDASTVLVTGIARDVTNNLIAATRDVACVSITAVEPAPRLSMAPIAGLIATSAHVISPVTRELELSSADFARVSEPGVGAVLHLRRGERTWKRRIRSVRVQAGGAQLEIGDLDDEGPVEVVGVTPAPVVGTEEWQRLLRGELHL